MELVSGIRVLWSYSHSDPYFGGVLLRLVWIEPCIAKEHAYAAPARVARKEF